MDARAYAEFAAVLRAAARKVSARFSADDLDDIVQRSQIRLQSALASGREIGNLQSYLYRVGTRVAIDLLREWERRRRLGDKLGQDPDEEAAVVGDPATGMAATQLACAIESALDVLPGRRAEVVRLHLMGYEPGEIAQALGLSWLNTRNLLYRGLRQLKGHLRDLGYSYARD
jgi:RNA polymerase sigma-70 factor (ECF subfamily)